jgi:signal peptidase II
VRRRHLLAFALVLVACVSLDQLSKQVATFLLAGSPAISLVGDAVRFELASNQGAFLSLGDSLPDGARTLIFLFLVPALLVVLCAYFLRAPHTTRAEFIAVGLIAGGGLGNWIDRLLQDGAVTDFVSLGVGWLRTGVFNVADLAVVGGALVLLFWPRREDAPRPEDA